MRFPFSLLALLTICLVFPGTARAGADAKRPSVSASSFAEAGPLLAQNGRNQKRQKRKQKRKVRKERRENNLSGEERQALEAEVVRKMDTFLTVELASRLGLDDAKALKLSRLLKSRRESHRAGRKELRAEYKVLKDLVDGGGGEKALRAQTQKVMTLATKTRGEENLIRETSGFLNAQEQAKLVLAYPHVRKEMQKMMQRARKKMRKRGRGPGGGSGQQGFGGLAQDF